eukprot:19000-Heterococcus_DN1.PRE.3
MQHMQKHGSDALNLHTQAMMQVAAAAAPENTTSEVQCAETSSQLAAMTAGEAASLQLSILLSLAHKYNCWPQCYKIKHSPRALNSQR